MRSFDERQIYVFPTLPATCLVQALEGKRMLIQDARRQRDSLGLSADMGYVADFQGSSVVLVHSRRVASVGSFLSGSVLL